MNVPIRDLELWAWLLHWQTHGELPVEPGCLLEQLEACASLPIGWRVPVTGLAARLLEDADRPGSPLASLDEPVRTPVRCALFGLLAGSTGHLVWQLCVDALDDGDDPGAITDLTRAAADALADSTLHDAPRWAHVLYHGRPAVRRLGVERLPPAVDADLVVPLLADPEVADLVFDQHLADAPTIVLPLLLQLWQHGALDAERLLGHLATWDWARDATTLLERLPYWDAGSGAEIAPDVTPDEVWAHALSHGAHVGASRDRLDVLIELLWEGVLGGVPSAAGIASALVRWAETSPQVRVRARLARAVLRVATRRDGLREVPRDTTPLLALAVLAFPRLLADERIDCAGRQRVLTSLAATAMTGQTLHNRIADPLRAVSGSPVLRAPGGALEADVLAGVLALAEKKPIEVLFEHLDVETVAELLERALRGRPAESIYLLCLPVETEPERKLGLALADALFTVADPDDDAALAASADALTHVARECRGLGLRVLAQLHRFHPEMIVALVPRVLAAHTDDPFSERTLERLSELLARQIGRRRFTDVIGHVLDTPDVLQHRMARSLLCAMGRTGSTRGFQEVVTALGEASVERLLALLNLISDLGGFPWGREKALAVSLTDHADKRVATWARARIADAPPEREAAAAHIEPASPLGRAEHDAIATCAATELPALVRRLTEAPRRGLCAALRARSAPTAPDVDIAVAILVAFDPLGDIDALLADHGYGSTEPDWLAEVDHRLAARHQASASLPLQANAWLRLVEARLTEMLTQIGTNKDPGKALLDLLDEAIGLRFAPLRERLFLAVGKAITRVRWRTPRELGKVLRPDLVSRCVDVLLAGTSEASRRPWLSALAAESRDRLANEPALKVAAAAVLRQAHDKGGAELALAEARPVVTRVAGELPPKVRDLLSGWLDAREVVGLYERFTPACPLSTHELADVTTSDDLAMLAGLCRGEHRALAEEAALRLCALGDEGRQALLAAVLEAPLWLHALALCVALLPDEAERPLRAAREAVSAPDTPVAARFHVALALLEREPEDRDALVESVVGALLVPSDAGKMEGRAVWMRPDDWPRLEALLGLTPVELARRVVTSPQPAAYQRAVAVLLEQTELEREALGAFLRVDARRPFSLRLTVARHLHAAGARDGWPLLLSQALALAPSDEEDLRATLFEGVDRESIRWATRAVLAVGDTHVDPEDLVDDLLRGGVDPVASRSALLEVLRETNDTYAQTKALDKLRDRFSRQRKLWRLADVFAWGADLGRELTGKLFGIELIGGQDLGYTRLNEGRVFVNPLPLLRGEQNGRAVVEALIAHEIGHHVYHSGPVGQALWARAAKEKLTGVFNLVLDEHLERNLRARREDVGNALKRLAAYAFQHNRREVHVERLIGHLGWRTFDVLVAAHLGVARAQGCVSLQTGEVFGTLESRGLSFSRFVRALRMGLGDRHDDPRVAEALEWFRGKRFRDASLDELYDIAVRLRQLFGDECAILDSLGQDGVCEAEEADVNRESEGLTNDEIQAEVERVRDPRRRRDRERDGEGRGRPGGKLWINVSEEHRFDRIERVVPLHANPTAHRALATEIARHSRCMREYLMRLGMRYEPQGARTRGRSVDRGRIPALVVRRDPRVLVMREPRMRTDLFLGIVVDCSGSMASFGSMDKARRFATLLAEAAVGLPHLDVRIFGFTDTVIYDAGTAGRCAAHAMESGGGNNDAAGLWHAAQVAMASRRKARLLVMISDGLPTECSVAALRGLVGNLGRRHKICCAQVAVRPLTEVCFPHYVEVTDGDLDASVRRFGDIVRKLVSRTLSA